MTLEPLLNIYLQAGLTALKTPYPRMCFTYFCLWSFIAKIQFASIIFVMVSCIVLDHLFKGSALRVAVPKKTPCLWRASGN